MVTCTSSEIKGRIGEIVKEVNETNEPICIRRYNQHAYMISEEDYKFLEQQKEAKRKKDAEMDALIAQALEPYTDIIKANNEKYPLTEEEYQEHIERFKRAMKKD